MRIALSAAIAVIVAIGLNGCGSSSPHADIEWPVPEGSRSVIGAMPLQTRDEAIRRRVGRMQRAADTFLIGDVRSSFGRYTARCEGRVCRYAVVEFPLPTDETTGQIRSVMNHRGVDLVQVRRREAGEFEGEKFILDGQAYWGLLQHSGFGSVNTLQTDGNMAPLSTSFLSYSFGTATGTGPAVNATWNGVMSGAKVDDFATAYELIQGDAAITVNLSAAPGTADVSFTNIRNLHSPSAVIADMHWSGAMLRDGRFETGTGPNRVQGIFYGPDHLEVGGTYERDPYMGAFGATRR